MYNDFFFIYLSQLSFLLSEKYHTGIGKLMIINNFQHNYGLFETFFTNNIRNTFSSETINMIQK